MNADAIFSMSVLNALLYIQDYLANNPGCTPELASRLLSEGTNATSGFDYGRAVKVLDKVPSLRKRDSIDRYERLQVLLKELIMATKPAWSKLIPNGRSYLKTYIGESDIEHCLLCAGLYESSDDPNIRSWWDGLAKHFRSSVDDRNTRIGRSGEMLSMEFETKRLHKLGIKLKPEWVALEDNTLGYDIKSYELEKGRAVPLFIEVKATMTSRKRFILTRNEWDRAVQQKSQFMLHLWRLESKRLDCLDYKALASNIPTDRGSGRWTQVEVILS